VTKVRLAFCTVIAVASSFAVAGAAHADTYTSTPQSENVIVSGSQGAPTTPTAPAPGSSSLPFTGGDVAGLTVAGAVLLGGGVLLVRRNRAKASQPTS